MVQLNQSEDPGFANRLKAIQKLRRADAGAWMLDGLHRLHRCSVQQFRDELRPSTLTAEDLTTEVLYRLLTGVIHGSPPNDGSHRAFLRLMGAIVQHEIENWPDELLQRDSGRRRPEGAVSANRSPRGILATFRESIFRFFRTLLAHPQLAAERRRRKLAELAREVLAGEYAETVALAERLDMTLSRTRRYCRLLTEIARHSTPVDAREGAESSDPGNT